MPAPPATLKHFSSQKEDKAKKSGDIEIFVAGAFLLFSFFPVLYSLSKLFSFYGRPGAAGYAIQIFFFAIFFLVSFIAYLVMFNSMGQWKGMIIDVKEEKDYSQQNRGIFSDATPRLATIIYIKKEDGKIIKKDAREILASKNDLKQGIWLKKEFWKPVRKMF